ncbi:unnamed protein product [Strongylus vulgaris]|uniref:Uncharacterized protein n=1 Tax=Strongylus vulgaris TaxID=40348 RepID=A0A3P7J7S9_STRVU|nr:unnamed protein product [Strongylus vulgaris]
MSFRGGGNSVSIHGYKGPVSSFNGAPPPQHTFGTSMAGFANANLNGGYGYPYAMQPQPPSSYGRGQGFAVGGGFRGRGGYPAFQYQLPPGVRHSCIF